jgi:hypothetical protein
VRPDTGPNRGAEPISVFADAAAPVSRRGARPGVATFCALASPSDNAHIAKTSKIRFIVSISSIFGGCEVVLTNSQAAAIFSPPHTVSLCPVNGKSRKYNRVGNRESVALIQRRNLSLAVNKRRVANRQSTAKVVLTPKRKFFAGEPEPHLHNVYTISSHMLRLMSIYSP